MNHISPIISIIRIPHENNIHSSSNLKNKLVHVFFSILFHFNVIPAFHDIMFSLQTELELHLYHPLLRSPNECIRYFPDNRSRTNLMAMLFGCTINDLKQPFSWHCIRHYIQIVLIGSKRYVLSSAKCYKSIKSIRECGTESFPE